MIKSAGILMIVCACVLSGAHIARAARLEQTQLQSMIDALCFIRSELSCRLRALPDAFAQLAASSNPQIAAFFSVCADCLGEHGPATLSYAFRQAMCRTPGLLLTAPAQRTLAALSATLGRQDLAGSVQALDDAAEQLRQELARLRSGGADRRRSYAAVCVCAGLAAAVILL